MDPSKISIVFMGSPEFAVPSLKALCEEGFHIKAVITQPAKPKGRGRKIMPTPVCEFARSKGIEVREPERLKDPEFVEYLRSLKPDLIVVVAYGKILPKEVLSIPRLGCINLHASLLPRWRGAAPVQRSLIAGDTVTGVTIMLMDEGMDTGPILLKKEVPIEKTERAGELAQRLSRIGAELLVESIGLYVSGRLKPTPQDDRLATYAPLIKKEEGRIDWHKPAVEIENLVRGLHPWPCAYTYLDGKLIKIHRASATEEESGLQPGRVVKSSKDGIYVSTGRGLLLIEELQPEGKKPMKAEQFARGYRIDEGTAFE
ncbi:MAG TPA: methionyl-tRNA formyltransferase [Deltaproteobacteria bacterium]|nr:methionyl-tRNA formyltransferase [Deltaproteobacteria bacterium]